MHFFGIGIVVIVVYLTGAAAVHLLPPAVLHLAQHAALLQVQQGQVHRLPVLRVWENHFMSGHVTEEKNGGIS